MFLKKAKAKVKFIYKVIVGIFTRICFVFLKNIFFGLFTNFFCNISEKKEKKSYQFVSINKIGRIGDWKS